MDEYGFWDGGRDPYLSSSFRDDDEKRLEAMDASHVGGGCQVEGEVIHRGEPDSPRDCHVKRGDVDEEAEGLDRETLLGTY